MHSFFFKIALGSLIAFAGLAFSTPAFAAPPKTMPETYQILIDHSIFSREPVRRARSRDERPAGSYQTPRNETPIFTGAIYDQTEYTAFLEDPQSGRVNIVRVGQSLPQGRVESITLDSLQLRTGDNGELRRIEVGHTLTGESRASRSAPPAAPPSSDTSANAATATQPNSAAPAPPAASGAASDIEQRMRERRRRELEGK